MYEFSLSVSILSSFYQKHNMLKGAYWLSFNFHNSNIFQEEIICHSNKSNFNSGLIQRIDKRFLRCCNRIPVPHAFEHRSHHCSI